VELRKTTIQKKYFLKNITNSPTHHFFWGENQASPELSFPVQAQDWELVAAYMMNSAQVASYVKGSNQRLITKVIDIKHITTV